ncbi:hypothetical protein Aau02nite_04710 [Amorphoplanes auranticolor]|uniref:Uncharacterized protein n=1 Tax=Actinoplanes auranticolor TaxID=47988 RepID=A0A919VIW0_9ACTN|nr:hypothetical protein Aau02nite_04710 [Actinoplanes auranticolor]
MRARFSVATDPASQRLAVPARVPVPRMNSSEGRRGKGGEDGRMLGNRLRDALAAIQTSAGDLEGVITVELRA